MTRRPPCAQGATVNIRFYPLQLWITLLYNWEEQLHPESAFLALWSGVKLISGRGTHIVAHLFLHACHVRQGATQADIDCTPPMAGILLADSELRSARPVCGPVTIRADSVRRPGASRWALQRTVTREA